MRRTSQSKNTQHETGADRNQDDRERNCKEDLQPSELGVRSPGAKKRGWKDKEEYCQNSCTEDQDGKSVAFLSIAIHT